MKSNTLNTNQLLGLEVLFDALIPSDEERQIPGAKNAGAVNYVVHLLANKGEGDEENEYFEINKWRIAYPVWLSLLNDASNIFFKVELNQLNRTQATQLLTALEQGKIKTTETKENQTKIFQTLWRHCIQACFGDPKYGGNKNRIMWKWYGYLEEPKQIKL